MELKYKLSMDSSENRSVLVIDLMNYSVFDVGVAVSNLRPQIEKYKKCPMVSIFSLAVS